MKQTIAAIKLKKKNQKIYIPIKQRKIRTKKRYTNIFNLYIEPKGDI